MRERAMALRPPVLLSSPSSPSPHLFLTLFSLCLSVLPPLTYSLTHTIPSHSLFHLSLSSLSLSPHTLRGSFSADMASVLTMSNELKLR